MKTLILLATLATLAACGGGEQDTAAPSPPPAASTDDKPTAPANEAAATNSAASVPPKSNAVASPPAMPVEAPPSSDDAMSDEPGAAVYRHYCAECHDRGEGHPGTMRLAQRLDTPVLRLRKDLSPDFVKVIVRNGLQMMPPFRPTEITDDELEQLASFVSAASLAAQQE